MGGLDNHTMYGAHVETLNSILVVRTTDISPVYVANLTRTEHCGGRQR